MFEQILIKKQIFQNKKSIVLFLLVHLKNLLCFPTQSDDIVTGAFQ